MTARRAELAELRSWQALLRGAAHRLRESPALLCQECANQAELPAAAQAARERLARESRAWLRWLNRPERATAGPGGPSDPIVLAALAGTVTIHAISPDGRRVLAGAWRTQRVAGPPLEVATLRLWEIASGRELTTHFENRPWRLSVLSPNGERFVAISTEPLTESWDERPLSDPDPYFRACALHDVEGGVLLRFSGRKPIQFSADGRRLLAATDEAELTIWETERGEEIARLAGGPPCLLSADGSRVVWLSAGGRLMSRDLSSGAETSANRSEFSGLREPETIAPVPGEFEARSGDGQRMASVEKARIRILDAATGQTLTELAGHSAAVSSVAFLPDGSALLSGSRDGTLRLWPLPADLTGTAAEAPPLLAGAVTAMVFSADGEDIVCTVGREELVRLGARSGRPRAPALKFPPGTLCGLSADGESLAEALQQIFLTVRSRDNRQVPLGRPRGKPRFCAFSPDGRRLLSVADSGEVSLWLTEGPGEPLRLQEGDGLARPPRCAAFSADGALVATASLSGTVRLWDLATGRARGHLSGGGLDAEACDISGDGLWVAAAHRRGVTLWSLASRELVKDFRQLEAATAAQFAPSAAFLATGDSAGRVRIFRCADWSLACEARCAGSISRLAWAPGCERLAVAAAGGVQIFVPIGLRR